VLTTIIETGKLDGETEAALRAGVESFRLGFMTGAGTTLGGADDVDTGLKVEQEQIVRQKKR
jgi:F-type H+-transporting ATPase subunit alpha